MRVIKLVQGAASIDGDTVVLIGNTENSDEPTRVELPMDMIQAISSATKKTKEAADAKHPGK